MPQPFFCSGVGRVQLFIKLGVIITYPLHQIRSSLDYQLFQTRNIGFGRHMRLFGFTRAFNPRNSLFNLSNAFHDAGMRNLLQSLHSL